MKLRHLFYESQTLREFSDGDALMVIVPVKVFSAGKPGKQYVGVACEGTPMWLDGDTEVVGYPEVFTNPDHA